MLVAPEHRLGVPVRVMGWTRENSRSGLGTEGQVSRADIGPGKGERRFQPGWNELICHCHFLIVFHVVLLIFLIGHDLKHAALPWVARDPGCLRADGRGIRLGTGCLMRTCQKPPPSPAPSRDVPGSWWTMSCDESTLPLRLRFHSYISTPKDCLSSCGS